MLFRCHAWQKEQQMREWLGRVPECLITSSREWTAWVNRMPGPGARPMLVVSGKVVAPTGGYQVAFDPRMQIRESYPAQAFVTLQVAGPGNAPASQAQVTHEVPESLAAGHQLCRAQLVGPGGGPGHDVGDPQPE